MASNTFVNALENISFEFFPPKTPEGMKSLEKTGKKLAAFSPSYFSVTYGAGGSTRKGTVDTVQLLQQSTPIPVAPHLACMGSTREELIEILEKYKAMGAKRIVALRGDLTSGMGWTGEFKYAADLVALIREISGNHFHIEVAAYPECHPQAKNALDDMSYLKEKFDAGADSAITQYFFNSDAYFYFVDECLKNGMDKPIVPGIMPITQFAKLVRFSDLCGAEIPRWLCRRLEAYGNDEYSLKAFGLEVVQRLCEDLLNGGAPGLHFYTLNSAEASVGLLEGMGVTSVLNKGP